MVNEQKKPYVNIPETIGYPPDKEEVKKKLTSIAGRIIDQTTFKFIHKQTGESFTESDELPASGEIILESGFNDWKYWNGVIHLAFAELSDLLGDEVYVGYIRQNYEFAFRHLPLALTR